MRCPFPGLAISWGRCTRRRPRRAPLARPIMQLSSWAVHALGSRQGTAMEEILLWGGGAAPPERVRGATWQTLHGGREDEFYHTVRAYSRT